MQIEIAGPTFDRWVVELERLVEADPIGRTQLYPDGGRLMSPRHVLGYLQHSSSGVHTVEIDAYHPDGSRKTRIQVLGDIVVLDPEGTDEARARDAIRNAERLTRVVADEVDDTQR